MEPVETTTETIAPVVEASNEVLDTSTVADTSTSTVETASEVTEPDTFLETFDWEAWDGEVGETIPEKYRGFSAKLGNRIRDTVGLREDFNKRVEDLTAFYQGLIDNPDKYDLKQLSGIEAQYKALQAEHDALLIQNNNLYTKHFVEQEAREAREAAARDKWITDFKEANADLFSDKAKAELFKAAISTKFDAAQSAAVARAPKAIADKAIELCNAGVPVDKCLKYATLELQPAAATVKPTTVASKLLDGGEVVGPSSAVSVVTDITKMSNEEARIAATERAFLRLAK